MSRRKNVSYCSPIGFSCVRGTLLSWVRRKARRRFPMPSLEEEREGFSTTTLLILIYIYQRSLCLILFCRQINQDIIICMQNFPAAWSEICGDRSCSHPACLKGSLKGSSEQASWTTKGETIPMYFFYVGPCSRHELIIAQWSICVAVKHLCGLLRS